MCLPLKYNKQQGIALIQVLIITAVLTILALFLTSTAKDQVKIAEWADDKSAALIAVHNAQAQLLFTLLTQPKHLVSDKAAPSVMVENITNQWNFFAKPFPVTAQVQASIQDQSALIHAHFPNKKHFIALLVANGETIDKANALYDNLLDWQDLDNIQRVNGDEFLTDLSEIRNGALPDLHDFNFIPGITPSLKELLVQNTTVLGKGFFNPMNAPKALLTAITNVEIAQQVMQLRASQQLTNLQFSQLTGIVENDKIILYPSNMLEIKLTGQVGFSVVQKSILIELTPYANEYQSPITIFSNKS
jgi:general secretion pathway protein K